VKKKYLQAMHYGHNFPIFIVVFHHFSVQNDLEVPESLSNTNRKLCCTGEKGLLTKILETLIECPTTAPLR